MPDRHVRRLFELWFPDIVERCRPRAAEPAALLGSRAREKVEFLVYSLVGAAVSPPGRSLSEADNLVWALGAYVERKGRERALAPR